VKKRCPRCNCRARDPLGPQLNETSSEFPIKLPQMPRPLVSLVRKSIANYPLPEGVERRVERRTYPGMHFCCPRGS